MPAWLVQILITFAVKFGLPWVLSKIPGVPEEVKKVIEEFLAKLAAHTDTKDALVAEAKQKVAQCYGPTCKV